MFLPQEVIRRKRDGLALDPEEIRRFVAGLVSGEVSDAQAAALAMAVCLRGMTASETVALTLAMRDSGTVLRWQGLDGPVLDKHSTGGVGDKVSLVLAPLLAAVGAFVPMISGRALGHTGGTLDKLESIPGYDTAPSLERFRSVVREVGCAIVGPTADLAPADGRLYAVRDATATVESNALIIASILSKKLAAGIGALVMDVKTGSGAFLAGRREARDLASGLVEVAEGAGLPCRALVTDMNQVLGSTAGNALEVREAVDLLTGRRDSPRLRELVLRLAVEALRLSGTEEDPAVARARLEERLRDGAAAERMGRMVRALGGPPDFTERSASHLPRAPVVVEVPCRSAGWIEAVDVRSLGLAVIELGGGRTATRTAIDPAVGLDQIQPVGARVDAGTPLCVIHAADATDARRVAARVAEAFRLASHPVEPLPLVYELVAAG